jgi:NADPH2:quinone reductase
MKAWLLDSLAGIDSLRLADIAEPIPGPGQVILDILYAGLNPADKYLSIGQYPAKPAFPHILGRDGIGVISSIGPDVNGFPVGQKCIILRGPVGVSLPGTFADKTAVPIDSLAAVPAGWTDQEAAGAALVYLTAYQALTLWPDLPAAGTVLVTGASGGVGVACVQLAKAMGHTVIALSRDLAKQTRLRQIGADITLNPTEANWRKTALEQNAGHRVDLAIDNIGGSNLPEVIDSLAEHGRVSCVGRLAGPVPQFNTASLFFRRLKMGGVAVGTYTAPQAQAAWEKVVELLGSRGAKPLVDSIFPFGEVKTAFARLAAGPMGKVLLRGFAARE